MRVAGLLVAVGTVAFCIQNISVSTAHAQSVNSSSVVGAATATTSLLSTPPEPLPASATAESNTAALTPTALNVEDKEDFVVEPGKMEVYVNPGDTVTEYISVTSRIEKTTEFAVSSEDFVGSTQENNPVVLLGDKKSPYSLKDWLTPAVNSFSLKFGNRVTLPVTITVPKNVSPGGYYAAVIISNAPDVNNPTVPTAGTARIISRIGVLFFVRINGPVNASGHLQDFRINPSQTVYSQTPNDFQILFADDGSIYLAPYGEIHIYNFFGSELADLPVDAYFAMPDSLRYRDISWADSAFRIGRYTAVLSLNRSYNNVVDTKTIVFWILPWKVITAFLVGLLVVVGIIYFFFSRFEFRRKQ